MPQKAKNPFKIGYDPELDTSPALDPDAVSYYLTCIGVLWWMIELGKIDIITELLFLSSHVALLREGHLEAAVHVMNHIGQRYDSRLVYYCLYQEVNNSVLKNVIGKSFTRMPRR